MKKPNALGRLVWSGTSRIIDDFEALLDTSTWAPMLMELAEDASQAKDMLTAALGTVLRNYAGTLCREDELFVDPSGDGDLMMNGRQYRRISFRGRITHTPTDGALLVAESRDVKFWLVGTEEARNSNVLAPAWWVRSVTEEQGRDDASRHPQGDDVFRLEANVLGRSD